MRLFSAIILLFSATIISASGQQEQSDTIIMLEPNEFYIKLYQSSSPLLLDVDEYKNAPDEWDNIDIYIPVKTERKGKYGMTKSERIKRLKEKGYEI